MNIPVMGSKRPTLRRRGIVLLVVIAFFAGILVHRLVAGSGKSSAAPFRAPSRSGHPHRHLTLAPVPDGWESADHLVMVAGHAVYTAESRSAEAVQNEASWFLEPFQKGQLQTMLSHIRRGVEVTAGDNATLLVFSGGETRVAAGPRSEAASYWEAAEAMGWFGFPSVRARSALEAQARDSFENLLFALCRFREATGQYPRRVTVVSFGFKRRRFVELHRAALRFPRSRFTYLGIDPPGLGLDVLRGELAHSAKPFERDPYGCAEAELQRKRAGRNPFRRHIAYEEGCPELTSLLEHCGPGRFAGPLPWSQTLGDDEDGSTRQPSFE